MLRNILCCILLALVSAFANGQQTPAAAPSPANTIDQDQYAVYAVAISGLFDNAQYKERKILIENRTVSMECGKDSCNLLDLNNGCSGMREPGQDVDRVVLNFTQTMRQLEIKTWEDFKQNNEHCAPLRNQFPLQHDYLWMEDSTKQAMIGKKPATDLNEQEQAAWSQPDRVFLSRPGFNADRTQALLYLGVTCHGQCSWFGYLLLNKVNGEWMPIGHYTVEGR